MTDALVARADGVPLFVEELTKAVLEPGAARDVEAIPATLADSLMARLDRLSTAKEVAQRAAVLGREFGYPLLAAMVGLDEAALRQGLARLVDAEILFARGELPAGPYTFKHALIQETAYQFPFYLGLGRALRGLARVESGEGEAGLAEMQQAMGELAGIGTGIGAPGGLCWLAESLRKVGRHDDAFGALGLGVAQAEQQGEHFYDAELHRAICRTRRRCWGSSPEARPEFLCRFASR